MNKLILALLIVSFSMMACVRHKPLQIQLTEPYIENIDLKKERLISHIRSVISEFFVSGKTVTDNIDSQSGIIQVNFSVDMGDVWGIPFQGSYGHFQGEIVDRTIDGKMNIYVKDNRYKIKMTYFAPRSDMTARKIYGRKKNKDYMKLQKSIVIGLSEKINSNFNSNDWDF
jgi:hypothetical protein